MIILVPLPLFGSSVVYGTAHLPGSLRAKKLTWSSPFLGVKGFTAWTAIGIIWMFCGFFTVVLYPVYESRDALAMVSKGVVKVRWTATYLHTSPS